jgi:hypothetical protein
VSFAAEPVAAGLPSALPGDAELLVSTHAGRVAGAVPLGDLRLAPGEGVLLRLRPEP